MTALRKKMRKNRETAPKGGFLVITTSLWERLSILSTPQFYRLSRRVPNKTVINAPNPNPNDIN